MGLPIPYFYGLPHTLFTRPTTGVKQMTTQPKRTPPRALTTRQKVALRLNSSTEPLPGDVMATKKTAEAAKAEATISAFKAFGPDWKCRDFQYKVGETYIHAGRVSACDSGFHACENPLDVLNYYDLCDSKFATVELSGEISRHGDDSKIAGGKITVKAELGLPNFIGAAVAYLMSLAKANGDKVQSASGYSSQLAASGYSSKLAASGDYSKLAASGDYSQLAASGYSSQLAASGDYSQLAASGDYSKLAASGDYSKLAASGYYSQLAASGYYSQLAASGYSSKLAASGDSSQLAASGYSSKLAASGKSSIAMAAATNCTAKAGELGCIVLSRWVDAEKRFRVSVGYVGEDGIKADVFYRLDEDGKFVEVDA